MSTLPHFWWTLIGGVYAADEESRPILLGAAEGESLSPRVQDGVGGGVAGSPLLGLSREGSPPSMVDTVGITGPQAIYGLLT